MIINEETSLEVILEANISRLKAVLNRTEKDPNCKYSIENRGYINRFFINYFYLGRLIEVDSEVEYSNPFEAYKELAEDYLLDLLEYAEFLPYEVDHLYAEAFDAKAFLIEMCTIRSAMEFFYDIHIAWLPMYFDKEKYFRIADVENAIKEKNNRIPPLKKEDVPEHVPESHWWWRINQTQ
jgi:hypothetical protein